MILFSDRKRLEEAYYRWLAHPASSGSAPTDCPFNVITFLVSESLLDEEKAKAFITSQQPFLLDSGPKEMDTN